MPLFDIFRNLFCSVQKESKKTVADKNIAGRFSANINLRFHHVFFLQKRRTILLFFKTAMCSSRRNSRRLSRNRCGGDDF